MCDFTEQQEQDEEDCYHPQPCTSDYPLCSMCGAIMDDERDFSHGCGDICYSCS